MYGTVTIVNNNVLYTRNLLIEKISSILTTNTHTHTHTHTHTQLCEAIDVLINLIVVIISQCLHVSKHHIVPLKYMQVYLPIIPQ